ncbi:MAG: exodeoxyribonuclease V subunit gamma [Deltaproteobacteria bacterium]|nr:exodeoxyribonuclease V subunit gamma [Deltaproteobacteria bacterium]
MSTQDWPPTPSFKIFTSNRLEILAEALASVLSEAPASPMNQEIIIVQSRGMERWVSAELAKRHGICANVCFPFPNAFVDDVFSKVLHLPLSDRAFSPNTMTWKILALLPTLVKREEFESLNHYLGTHPKPLKTFQLATQVAHTFDQYLTYRPEMVLRWQEGLDHHWQAVLWRAVVKDLEKEHRPARAKAFFDTVKRKPSPSSGLPARVSVFGISVLPRFHMEVLAAVSHMTEVFLFLMNPCRQYWGDIVSEWEIRRATDRTGGKDMALEDLYLEKGNSLLASMGKMGRDFFDLVNEFPCEESSLFEDPTDGTLLSLIQSDILNLQEAGVSGTGKRVIRAEDESIRIHVCHSPMREIEVLYDQLLHMFEQDPDLEPKDVLVMTPDIEAYAPYIGAVFDVPVNKARRFPFNLADRSARRESPVVEAFLSLLELCGTRFKASEVMAVLESAPVRARFSLSEPDLEKIRTWIAETRIRWGIDAENRKDLGLPATRENTWAAGLERLILGYALPGHGEHAFQDILPYDPIEGADTLILGRFMDFVDRLVTLIRPLAEPRSLASWSRTLSQIIDTFLDTDDDSADEHPLLRNTVLALGEMEQDADFHALVDISVIKAYLTRCLETESVGFGFMAGGITFCAMLPMRSIPFKVICLVGMNADAYPRESRQLGFDLIARHPRPGDRSRRDDDRYLFLESLLSARSRLHISYVGQDIQDNTPIPPSVLVSELMDYIEQGFEIPGCAIVDHLITKHRLQPFSPVYFSKDAKLFSYCEQYKHAAQALLEGPHQNGPFISKGISTPETRWKHVSVGDLCQFFGNPARFLMNRRLGIYLDPQGPILEDAEAFSVTGLDRYHLEQALLERSLSAQDLKGFRRVVWAAGQLPHGTVGTCLYDSISQAIERFSEQTAPYIPVPLPAPLAVDLDMGGFRITGHLHGVGPKGLVQYRYAVLKGKDRVSLWIRHLVLNCLKQHRVCRASMLVGLHKTARGRSWVGWQYPPLPDARKRLQELLEIYWDGLTRPLPFFSESSWAYADQLVERKLPEDQALIAAWKQWWGDDWRPGERQNPYYQLCFEGTDPLGPEFTALAIQILSPIMANQKKAAS